MPGESRLDPATEGLTKLESRWGGEPTSTCPQIVQAYHEALQVEGVVESAVKKEDM